MISERKKWNGSTPKCDFCGRTGKELEEFVDGKTTMGPWGIMCLIPMGLPDSAGGTSCYDANGVGIGQGRGQLYRLENGVYFKTAG